jgi:hypothetical protein
MLLSLDDETVRRFAQMTIPGCVGYSRVLFFSLQARSGLVKLFWQLVRSRSFLRARLSVCL